MFPACFYFIFFVRINDDDDDDCFGRNVLLSSHFFSFSRSQSSAHSARCGLLLHMLHT